MVPPELESNAYDWLLSRTVIATRAAIAVADERGFIRATNEAWGASESASIPLVPAEGRKGVDYAAFCRNLAQEGGPLPAAARGILGVLEGGDARYATEFLGADCPLPREFGVNAYRFSGGNRRWTGIAIADISERQAMARRLQENQEILRIISENAADQVVLLDAEGRPVYRNAAYGRNLGFAPEEIAQLGPADLLHPEDRGPFMELRRRLLASRGEAATHYRMVHKDGSLRHFEGRAAAVGDGEGGARYLLLVDRDVTERVLADLETLRSHAIKALVLEHTSFAFAFVRHRVFEWGNSRLAEIFGWAPEDILGASTRMLYPDEETYRDRGRTLYEGLSHDGRAEVTWRLLRKDGSPFWCRLFGKPLNPQEPDEGSVWILEDADAKVEAEQRRMALEVQLRHAQKLEAIGQLAAGIAHEINTPTQYIGDNTNFLAGAFRDLFKVLDRIEEALGPEPLRTFLEEADVAFLRQEIPLAIQQSQEGVDRVAQIVRAMKDFSHPGGDSPVEVDLNRSIESTITVSRNEWKYVADLELDLDPDLEPMLCYPGEINQAVLNLVVNSAHAIRDALGPKSETKGRIRVSTRQDGGTVELRVQDSGTGIPEDVRPRIFDPFFTTKPVGQGTGQGLAIVHSVVVERHRGSVAFETEPGRGTTFILRIPMAPPDPGKEKAHG